MARVDLHMHSTASDGTRSPSELAVMASGKSLALFSLTDHDTLDGVPEAAATAAVEGVDFVAGVELSVNLDTAGLTAHLLGYFPDSEPEELIDSDTPLGRAIAFVQGGRERRNPLILKKLSSNGINIDMNRVRTIAGGDVVGRPHIAQAMLEEGYVGSMQESFNRFLARGKPAYVERDRLPVIRAIELIRNAGGLAVMAHPGYIQMDRTELQQFFGRMKTAGLSGIEVYYPTHEPATVKMLKNFACEFDLFVTGGTDYHGRDREAAPLGGTEKGFHVDSEKVEEFMDICL
ncbi:MAG: PHP domain-containing protein [Candidatus Aegiribacteria sp.]|nr:PHP domain-containing protein [Candidatus Aegiribacteria sp.]MBD3295025.1 PHP domain-containing protein [Candidatus Fermentibacteria bacterium]